MTLVESGRWPLHRRQRLVHALGMSLLQPAVPLATLVAFRSAIRTEAGDLRRDIDPVALLGIAGCGAAAVLVVVGLAMVIAGRLSIPRPGWRGESVGRVLGSGVSGACACIGALFLAMWIFGFDLKSGLEQVLHYSPSQRVLFAIVGLLIALLEESVFRGYLQPALVERLGLAGGIVVTAAFYGLYHFPAIQAVSVTARVLQGLTYGVLRGRDRPLLAPALAHFLYWSVIGLL